MSHNIRCFMVADLETANILLNHKVVKYDRRIYANEAPTKVGEMRQNQEELEGMSTRVGEIFAKTDEKLAYLVFVDPNYPENLAKELAGKHMEGVQSMIKDETFKPDTPPENAYLKAHAAVCKGLTAEYESKDIVNNIDQSNPKKSTGGSLTRSTDESSEAQEEDENNFFQSIFTLVDSIKIGYIPALAGAADDDDDDDDDDY